ncbi:hypothetical protein Tco_0531684 [Tanacetum coccineum]
MAVLALPSEQRFLRPNNHTLELINTRNQALFKMVKAKAVPQNSNYFKERCADCKPMELVPFWKKWKLLFLAGESGNSFDADVDKSTSTDLALNEDNIFQ